VINIMCSVKAGDTYIRWGRTTCGRGAQLVYQGKI